MYIVKNAFKNLGRNKSRNIIIALVLLTAVIGITVGGIVQSVSKNMIQEFQDSFKVSVNIDMDYEAIEKDYPAKEVTDISGLIYMRSDAPWEDIEPSVELLRKEMDSKYLDSYIYQCLISTYTDKYTVPRNKSTMFNEFDVQKYLGKDKEFFVKYFNDKLSTAKKYYLSDEFHTDAVYSHLYDEDHTVTEQEATDLAARKVFGDEAGQRYLKEGLTDEILSDGCSYQFDGATLEDLLKYRTRGFFLYASSAGLEESYFNGGSNKLIQGTYPINKDECIVSERAAQANGWQVGDTITLESTIKNSNAKMKLKITGICENTEWESMPGWTDYSPDVIFITFDAWRDADPDFEAAIIDIEAVEFTLKNKEDLDKFEAELRENGLSKYCTVKDNLSELEKQLKPLQNIEQISLVFMIAIFAVGGGLFILMSFLAIRERQYEIGVLRAIGMRKKGIIAGLCCETFIIVMACCIIGIGTGQLLAKPAADYIVNFQQEDSDETISSDGFTMTIDGSTMTIDGSTVTIGSTDGTGDPTRNGPDSSNALSEMNLRLSLPVALEIIAAALFLGLLSALMNIIYITKFEPMKILSDNR